MQMPELWLRSTTCHQAEPHPSSPRWTGSHVWPEHYLVQRCNNPGSLLGVQDVDGVWHSFTRRPQEWHLLAPGTPYRFRIYRRQRTGFRAWLFFGARGELPFLGGRRVAVLRDPHDRLLGLLRGMHAHRFEPGTACLRESYLQAFVGEFAQASQRGGSGDFDDPWTLGDPDEQSLFARVDRAARELIEAGRAPSLEDLAGDLGMSASSLAHRYRREIGGTVMARVRWLRVDQARQLLLEPGATLKSIAARLGFSSPFHLSRLFKEIIGVSPRDFRRQRLAERQPG